MRREILVLMALSVFVTAFTQKNEEVYTKDDYIRIIDTTKTDEAKIAALQKLMPILIKEDPESTLTYFDMYIDISLKMKKYQKAMQLTGYVSDNIAGILQDPLKMMPFFDTVENLKDKVSDTKVLGDFYASKGRFLETYSKYDEAINSYNLAVGAFDPVKDSLGIADATIYRAVVYGNTGQYLEASNDFRTAATYFENLGDVPYTIYAISGLVNVYDALGFHEKAIEERLKLIEKRKNVNVMLDLPLEYYHLALAYSKTNESKKEKESMLTALEICKEQKECDLLLLIHANLINISLDANDTKAAKKYMDLAENEYKKEKTLSPLFTQIYDGAKQYYLHKTKQYDKAIRLGETVLQAAKENNNTSLDVLVVHNLLFRSYVAIGDATNALKNHSIYQRVKDSLRGVDKANAFSYYQTLYETEKKEKEILEAQHEITLLDQQNRAKNRTIIILTVSAVILILAVILFIKRRQLQKEKKLQQKFSQDLLVTQEEERKRISEDLHDGLGQSLLLVKNQLTLKDYKKTKGLLNNVIEEMRTIAKVLYPFQLKDAGVSRALENLIIQLNDHYKDIYIFGDIDDLKGKLTDMQEVNIFRIVQECLSNIVKHAQAESAKVSLSVEEDEVHILVEDNGKGFDFSNKYDSIKTLGLKTIQERINFLKGSLQIDTAIGRGSSFSINLPLSA